MKRLLLSVILVTGCAGEAVAPPPLLSTVASVLHLDHSAFASLFPVNRPNPDCFMCPPLVGTPIAHAADYFTVASSTVNQGDGIATAPLPVGPVNGVSAVLYLDDTGLAGGASRIIDVILWRVESGPCPAIGDTRSYCPVASVSATASVQGGDPNGQQTKAQSAAGLIESGYTYVVIANLRGDVAPNQRLRIYSVDITYGTTPAPMAAVMDPATRERFTVLSRNLAARPLMP